MGHYYQPNQATIIAIQRCRLGNNIRQLCVDAKMKRTGRIVSFRWTFSSFAKNPISGNKLIFEDFDAFWRDERAKGKDVWLYCTVDLRHAFMRMVK